MRNDRSYKRYKKYRENRYRYEQEQITFPLALLIGFAMLYQYWYIFLVIFAILIAFLLRKPTRRNIQKSTQPGYINKHNQKNIGCTFLPGTDHNQQLYAMECLNCGCNYRSNGTNIYERKCPNCQGGKP